MLLASDIRAASAEFIDFLTQLFCRLEKGRISLVN